MAKSRSAKAEAGKARTVSPKSGADAGARSDKKREGRPPKFTEVEVMAEKIEAYFESCEPKLIMAAGPDGKDVIMTDAKGKPMFNERPPTVAGLARALGFEDRHAIAEYGKKPDFSAVIKAAKLRIEEYWETRLAGNAPTGSIFWLKNHAAYVDKSELSGPNGGPIEVAQITRKVVDPGAR